MATIIIVDATSALAMLASLGPKTRIVMAEVINHAAEWGRDQAIANIDSDTGNLAENITVTDKADPALLKATITADPPEGYAAALERGSRPHIPGSYDRLSGWAGTHGWSTANLKAYITEHGTAAHPYMQPMKEQLPDKVSELAGVALTAFLAL